MRCEQIQELFSPYLDKMTNTKENQGLEAHLQTCSACADKLEQMSRMCNLLKNLDTIQVPDGFADNLHRRIELEKVAIFSRREVKIPLKPSWLVTSVAGIALSIGVFMSSYLPWGTMVADMQQWLNKDNTKAPYVANVDDVLEKYQMAQKDNTSQVDISSYLNTGSADNTGNMASKPATLPGGRVITNTANSPNSNVNVAVVASQPKIADTYNSKITVDDMGSSLQKVIELATTNGGDYALLPSGSIAQATASTNVKIISIQVSKEKLNQLLSNLAELGASNPSRDTQNLTTQYTNTVNELTTVAESIKGLETKANLTADEQNKLSELKKRQETLTNNKATMDKELNLVTVEVRLIEQLQQ